MKNNKGFTIIELLVVIAVVAILVFLAAPRLLGYTDKAKVSELTTNTRLIQDAAERYYFDHDEAEWPRLTDTPYTKTKVNQFAEKIYDITGKEVDLDEDGNYYDIDFDNLKSYIDIPGEKANYILQNPVGKVYFLYKPTQEAMERLPEYTENEQVSNGYTQEQIKDLVDQGYKTVSTAEDLNNVRKDLAGLYIQVEDINLSEYSTGKGWDPIGDNSTYNDNSRFTGIYNGGNYKITGLTINRPTEDYVGLFGNTSGATIKNVGLENVNVTGKGFTAGLVGNNDNKSAIKNSYVTGSVTGAKFTGGLVGYNYDYATISNSYATGDVTGTGKYTGGLVGYNHNDSSISNSYATGSVTGGENTGGLVGRNGGAIISNSYATGSVTGTNNTGGLVGYNFNTIISNSYATGSVTGTSEVGSLVGVLYNSGSSNTSTVKNSYALESNLGLIGEKDYSSTGSKDNNIVINSSNLSELQMKDKSFYNTWDFEDSETPIWTITSENYPTLVSNPEN